MLSTMGETKRKKQLQEWKASIWSLKIDLRQLRKRTRQAEHQLECEVLKRRKIKGGMLIEDRSKET